MKYICIMVFMFVSIKSYCQDSLSGKSGYNLFHPTPKYLMRDFATDRPDATESPITVDAGHFQLETDLFKTERSNIDGIKSVSNSYNAVNLKLGITNSLDLQFVIGTYSTSSVNNAGTVLKGSRLGDGLTIRAKQNLWGNDNGKTAFGILPFVNIPVTRDDKFSGGIVFPFAISLSNGWNLGAEFETNLVNDNSGNNYHVDPSVAVTTSHSITKNLDFFGEGVVLRNNEIKMYEYFFDGGLVYSFVKNVNMDGGFYYGIKNISSKTYFLGFSFRI